MTGRVVRSEGGRCLAAAAFALLLFTGGEGAAAPGTFQVPAIPVEALPREAQETLQLIKRGGPFPYAKDGSTFGNREQLLPERARGYYREYTVRTPGARDRGARRIVAGGCGSSARPDRQRANREAGPYYVAPCVGGEYYYTEDHYASFRRVRE